LHAQQTSNRFGCIQRATAADADNNSKIFIRMRFDQRINQIRRRFSGNCGMLPGQVTLFELLQQLLPA